MRACFALILAVITLTSPNSRADLLHPQDGPHVELRISVEDDAVRWTVGANLAFIDEMIPPARESLQSVSEGERGPLLEQLEAVLREQVKVSLDGEGVTPTIDSIQLYADPDPSLVVLFPKNGMRALIRCVAVLVYPTDHPPETVDLTWPTYPADMAAAEFEASADPPKMVLEAQLRAEGTMKLVRFSEADPTVTWRRGWDEAGRFEPVPDAPPPIHPVRVSAITLGLAIVVLFTLAWFVVALARRREWFAPLMGAVIAGALAWALSGLVLIDLPMSNHAKPPTDDQVRAAFLPMHANLYRAFDYTAESDVYDSLARTVEGPLLQELYTQVRSSLIQAEQGGMVGLVTGLHPGDLEVVRAEYVPKGDALVAQAVVRHTWTVDGTVYHWGHSHTRQIQYQGEYTLTALPDGWRLTANRILSQTRLDPGANPTPPAVEDLLRSVGGEDI
ncbi:MAG: hypothetical protein R3B57_09345 [Phycisphaerales bacterium]